MTARRERFASRHGQISSKIVIHLNQALLLSSMPPVVDQIFNLALERHQAGRLAEAEALYRQILALQPNHADAMHLLGVIAHQSGRSDLAVAIIRQSIALDPSNPSAFSNLGEAYRFTGHFAEAVAAYRDALRLKPDYPEARNNLGIALSLMRLTADAIAEYRQAIQLRPAYPDAYNNLGVALQEHGDLDGAIEAYRTAIQFRPDYAGAFNNLGDALKDQGRSDEAVTAFRTACTLQPQNAALHSNLIYAQQFAALSDQLAIQNELDSWNGKFGHPAPRLLSPRRPDASGERPLRPLRIGYVSPNFHDHVIGRNLRPLFKYHDQRDLELFCYSAAEPRDNIGEQLRQSCRQWRTIAPLDPQATAELIRQDDIDILVDLTQHMAGNQLPLFALEPAPVQVSFAGYPDSAGLPAIPNRITDRYLEIEDRGSEIGDRMEGRVRSAISQLRSPIPQLRSPNPDLRPAERVYLLDSFWCYDPCGMEVAVNDLPARSTNTITFGCLNNFGKVNDPLLQLWARVVKAVQDSRLIILSRAGRHRQRTVEFLAQEGIASHRVEFVSPRPRQGYLELYHRLDIVLDTFPYNGHTTSLDALWMGVPVVSLCGERPVSRAGWSQLSNLGLPELVAFAGDQYVEIASKLATDIPHLRELRATLRPRMEKSVLMDGPHFARQIEACYRAMWREWCARAPSAR